MSLVNRFVIMGVAGSGKSYIGTMLAEAIGAAFVDGDDLHPKSNIDKMSLGVALNDKDREPWLSRIGQDLGAAQESLVIACSALKRKYREAILAEAGAPVHFLYLDGSRELLLSRISARKDHFMPVALLDSQLDTLEIPCADEPAIIVSIDQSPEAIVALLKAEIARLDP